MVNDKSITNCQELLLQVLVFTSDKKPQLLSENRSGSQYSFDNHLKKNRKTDYYYGE